MDGGYPARTRILAADQTQLQVAPREGTTGLPSHHGQKGKGKLLLICQGKLWATSG